MASRDSASHAPGRIGRVYGTRSQHRSRRYLPRLAGAVGGVASPFEEETGRQRDERPRHRVWSGFLFSIQRRAPTFAPSPLCRTGHTNGIGHAAPRLG